METILIKHIKNENGMALALVLMIFAVVSIIAATGLTIALSQTKQSVSNQNYVEAYYVARSATDVVSADIINKIIELNNMQRSTPEETLVFEAFKAKVDKMLTTSIVTVDGIVPGNPVQSNVIVTTNMAGQKLVVVSTTYVKDGRSSTAKVQLGMISPQTITVSGVKSVIYSWGDINIGNNLTVVGDANIAYGGTTAQIKDNVLKAEQSLRNNVDIITPPALGIKTGSTLYSSNKSTININSDFNGSYGVVEGNYFDWNVDTSLGDVILIFDQLTINQASTINVTGANNLYIYLKENNANTGITPLFNAKNNFSIISGIGTPKTYIISYTKSMQDIYNSTGAINVAPNLLIPLDTVYIKNSAELDAFFYLPGCDFKIEEGPTIIGSIFAGKFTIGNSANIKFESYATNSVLNVFNTSTSQTKTIETFVFTDSSANIKRLWVK
ncbi:MAG: hypothetical protein JJE17_08240 [Peptostreptococcaceae bacterium]|nr:hypothetical protein [Peptostreptococcaceae bacterium]